MYRIESRDEHGIWTPEVISASPGANHFSQEAAAWEAVEELRRLGDDWRTAEYRVVDGS